MAACVILTAVSTAKAGRCLALALVEEKLAACVTVLPGAVSHYRWKRRIESSREAVLLIKSDRRLWPVVRRFLREHHPYEIPEMLVLSVSGGSKEYLSWLNACLKK